jgi:hypothetical protein
METGETENEWESPKKLGVLRLILKRLVHKLGYRIWNGWLSFIVFGLVLVLIMYLISSYECSVRRALGYPLSRTKNMPSHGWERNCETESVKP